MLACALMSCTDPTAEQIDRVLKDPTDSGMRSDPAEIEGEFEEYPLAHLLNVVSS